MYSGDSVLVEVTILDSNQRPYDLAGNEIDELNMIVGLTAGTLTFSGTIIDGNKVQFGIPSEVITEIGDIPYQIVISSTTNALKFTVADGYLKVKEVITI